MSAGSRSVPSHQQPYGLIHGGVHCTLAETLASAGAAFWAMEQGMAGAVGLSNKTDFIKGITEGVIVGEATPIHRGRTHQIWQIFNTREERRETPRPESGSASERDQHRVLRVHTHLVWLYICSYNSPNS